MVRNYFAYMFGRYTELNWFQYLKEPADEALLSRFADMDRHMWCTGGFLHAAGYAISHDGKILTLAEGCDSPVFTFDKVRIACSDNGITKWQHDETSKERFIFHVQDTDNYQSATTRAMKSLLTELP
ncbi:MAG: hypothetical protein JSW47_13645, partial [Phycisphaerales bacterium]